MTKLSQLVLIAGLSLVGCGGVAVDTADPSALTFVSENEPVTDTLTPIEDVAVAACASDPDTGVCTNGGSNCGKTASGTQCTCLTYTRGCGCGIQNPGGTFTPCDQAQ